MKQILLATLLLFPSCPLWPSPLSSYLWKATYDDPQFHFDDYARGLALWGNHVYVVGSSVTAYPAQPPPVRFVTLNYSADGTSLDWSATYQGPVNADDFANGVVTNALGNVYVVGSARGVDTDDDMTTVKYSPGGQELWVRRHDGGFGGRKDRGIAIAAAGGPGPRVFVTGLSESESTDFDYLTLCYDEAGTLVWDRRYDGPPGGRDQAGLIAAHSGAVTVTGWSKGTGSGWDFATLQYSIEDGSTLWSDRYNGAANVDDGPAALAVDEDGERVYVTGRSRSEETYADFATIAYAKDGSRLWVKRWAGTGADESRPHAIAARGGAVYVAGETGTGTTGYDLALVKYDRDDLTGGYGREIWARRYDGPGEEDQISNSDAALGMALGPNGAVHLTGSIWTERHAALTLKYSPSGVRVGPLSCYDADLLDRGHFIAVDAAGDAYVVGQRMRANGGQAQVHHYDLLTLKYPSSSDKFKFVGSWHKVASLIGSIRFQDPVDMEGSMELEVADIGGFPGAEAIAVTSMELRAASGEAFRLAYPRPREDPVLATTQGRVPGSFVLNTARDRSAQAWVALEGDAAALDRGFQGFCILPQPEVADGLFSGDPEHPSSLEFTRSQTRGFPPGLGLYQYRVRCPDPEGTAGCKVELKLHGVITLTAKVIPQPPVSPPDCVKASDFFAQPQQGLGTAILGPVSVQAAIDSAGATRPLEIADTNADGFVDLFVRWSRESAARPAAFDFSQVCAPGLPIAVTITFTTLGDDVVWEALRGTTIVGSHVSIVGPAPQTVSFTPAGGLDRVWIREGFDVCIHEICWHCLPVAAGCEVSKLAAGAGPDGIDGSFELAGGVARDAGSGLALTLHELFGGAVDLEGRLSMEAIPGSPLVRFSIAGRCEDLLPDGEAGFLCVSAPCADGLRGADCVAVRCPMRQRGKLLQRGDCNGDRGNDISDAVFNLGYLFLGGDPPGCAEACDMNADGVGDISDSVYLLAHLFLGGPPPAAPFPDCGTAPGPAGRLGCQRSACE